jgi:hypothetical protein
MKPTTKQMKIAASLWKRRFNYPRAKRKKAKHIKGLLLQAPPSECMKREKMRSQIILSFGCAMKSRARQRALILYTF